MLGRKTLLAVGAVVAGLLLPAQAMAQYEAVTDADLNLRVGPGTEFGVIDVIPYGDVVDVFGCLNDVEWCDIEWYGLRGWVSALYLVQPGTSVYLPQVYARIGVPIISFSFGSYHDRYYRDRPWYRERSGRWRGRDWRRGDRPRRERGEDRRDRRDRRDADRPREQREVEPSRQQRQIERARQQRQQELQEAERPRRQRDAEPSRQQRQIERAKQQRQQQLQEAEQPRQGARTQRPRQAQEAEQPRQRQRPQRKGRSGSDGPSEEMLDQRGQ